MDLIQLVLIPISLVCTMVLHVYGMVYSIYLSIYLSSLPVIVPTLTASYLTLEITDKSFLRVFA